MRQPGSDARYLASIALSNSLRIELLLAPVAEAFSPSVTSIPISLKTVKMRKDLVRLGVDHGEALEDVVRGGVPCSLPLMMSCSATAITSSSNLGSGFFRVLLPVVSVLVAVLAMRAISLTRSFPHRRCGKRAPSPTP